MSKQQSHGFYKAIFKKNIKRNLVSKQIILKEHMSLKESVSVSKLKQTSKIRYYFIFVMFLFSKNMFWILKKNYSVVFLCLVLFHFFFKNGNTIYII